MVSRTKIFDKNKLCDLCVEGDLKTIQSEFAHVDFNEFLLLKSDLMTPLMIASEYGHKDLAKWLLEKDVDVFADADGKTALHYALDNQHTNIAKLIYRSNKKKFDKKYLFRDAIGNKETTVVLFLLNEGITFYNDEFLLALEKGNAEIVDAFIEKGAYFQAKKGASFSLKTKWNRFVRQYFKHHCWQTYEPIEKAAASGNYETTKRLIEWGADITGEMIKHPIDLPIFFAIKSNDKDIVDLFLQNGVSLTDCSSLNQTPVDYAFLYGSSEMTAYLLKLTDSVEESNICYYPMQETPYSSLCHKNHIFKYTDRIRMTGLFASINLNRLDVVKELVQLGYDVNCSAETGFTPLMAAVEKKNKDIVEFLISQGADIEAKNNGGLNAIQIARKCRHFEIAKLLCRHLRMPNHKKLEDAKKELNTLSQEQLIDLPNKNLRLYRMIQRYGLEELWFNKMPYLNQIKVYKTIRSKMKQTTRLKVEYVIRQTRGRGDWR